MDSHHLTLCWHPLENGIGLNIPWFLMATSFSTPWFSWNGKFWHKIRLKYGVIFLQNWKQFQPLGTLGYLFHSFNYPTILIPYIHLTSVIRRFWSETLSGASGWPTFCSLVHRRRQTLTKYEKIYRDLTYYVGDRHISGCHVVIITLDLRCMIGL